ncbi:hypothetical protein NM688_g1278 [Phlebia brevispora]|uniref:Uncharacterized protein n=1 Tax=Phlebia brevispora TaxID=194682 RepID=A0ACC1TC49_9APHY|nr:hypothetical protein NM688_g1278 [Phlebia brevispora]
MTASIKRTYGSRSIPTTSSSPPPSDLASSPPSTPRTHKRPLAEDSSLHNTPPRKKTCLTFPSKSTTFLPLRSTKSSFCKSKAKGKEKDTSQKQLTQLHFSLDTTVLRTCSICDLTYTRGAPDDELLHKTHCARVQRGLEWGKEEERDSQKADVEELSSSVKLKNGSKGRIVCFRADVTGKIGAKLSTLLDTINLTLSSPPLPSEVLHASKVYLFLLPSPTSSSSSHREKIVGCVIAQRITTAMEIASPEDVSAHDTARTTQHSSSSVLSDDAENEPPDLSRSKTSGGHCPALIPVDASSNLYVHPTPLPTPMGIPRLFVSSSHRRLGIASRLLSVAAKQFILGCPLDPAKGEVAFTQPTGAGKAVLEKWGKGGVRIYEG